LLFFISNEMNAPGMLLSAKWSAIVSASQDFPAPGSPAS